MKYPVGTKLICSGVGGVVILNYKLPGDVCVKWEYGLESSYDKEWLDKNTEIVNE